jgi:hypothetical protein
MKDLQPQGCAAGGSDGMVVIWDMVKVIGD